MTLQIELSKYGWQVRTPYGGLINLKSVMITVTKQYGE